MEMYATLYFGLAKQAREKAGVAIDANEKQRLLRVAVAYEEAARAFETHPEAA